MDQFFKLKEREIKDDDKFDPKKKKKVRGLASNKCEESYRSRVS